MTAPVPSRLPRSTTRGEQPTDGGGDGGREVEAAAEAVWIVGLGDGSRMPWLKISERTRDVYRRLAVAALDAARAAAAPTSEQREEPRIVAVLALHAAHHCSCGGRRWVEDQNWAPPSYNRGQQREEGAGLMPCGFCNHGGWNVDQWDEDGAVSCDECDQDYPCPTVRALQPAALLAEQPGGGR